MPLVSPLFILSSSFFVGRKIQDFINCVAFTICSSTGIEPGSCFPTFYSIRKDGPILIFEMAELVCIQEEFHDGIHKSKDFCGGISVRGFCNMPGSPEDPPFFLCL